jgi:hypothetical protein
MRKDKLQRNLTEVTYRLYLYFMDVASQCIYLFIYGLFSDVLRNLN